MKRMLKRRERPAARKNGLTQKRRYFRRIKNVKEKFIQITTPHNTSQYLIENNSSPFYEDDDIDADFIPSSIIILEDSEELLEDDSNYQRKTSSASTLGESIGMDLHLGKQTSIFSLK